MEADSYVSRLIVEFSDLLKTILEGNGEPGSLARIRGLEKNRLARRKRLDLSLLASTLEIKRFRIAAVVQMIIVFVVIVRSRRERRSKSVMHCS